jgi:hypothetical protein
MKRTHYVIYAVILKEHPEIIKIGRTTKWKTRRREYDTWNFANGDGVLDCLVYCITDEYVDLAAVESACISGLATICSLYRGNEWFHGTLADARRVVEDVLCAGQISFVESDSLRAHKAAPRLVKNQ